MDALPTVCHRDSDLLLPGLPSLSGRCFRQRTRWPPCWSRPFRGPHFHANAGRGLVLLPRRRLGVWRHGRVGCDRLGLARRRRRLAARRGRPPHAERRALRSALVEREELEEQLRARGRARVRAGSRRGHGEAVNERVRPHGSRRRADALGIPRRADRAPRRRLLPRREECRGFGRGRGRDPSPIGARTRCCGPRPREIASAALRAAARAPEHERFRQVQSRHPHPRRLVREGEPGRRRRPGCRRRVTHLIARRQTR